MIKKILKFVKWSNVEFEPQLVEFPFSSKHVLKPPQLANNVNGCDDGAVGT